MRIAIALVIAVALAVIGCGAPVEPVNIITGPPHPTGCFAFSFPGLLVADPTYGTAFHFDGDQTNRVVPVAWRPGFTARRSGSEVAVFDPNGNPIAVTGRHYRIPGGGVDAGGSSGIVWPELRVGVFWACGTPEPLESAVPT
jgi:hypothetical protein